MSTKMPGNLKFIYLFNVVKEINNNNNTVNYLHNKKN